MKKRPAALIPLLFVIITVVYTPISNSSVIAGGLPRSTAEVFPQFYTIQAGSYAAEERAQVKYQELAEALHIFQLDHLRIEHVGSYYTVRLGKFDSRTAASELLASAGEHLAGAAILQAYILEERITRMYQATADDLPIPESEEIFIQEKREVSVAAVQSHEAEEFQSTPQAVPSLPMQAALPK